MGLYIWRNEHRPPVLEVYFFKLNKGRSIFIHTPHNSTILIDGGQSSDVIREITKVLPFYRRRIDVVIATREEAKNIGGLVNVFKRFEIGKIIVPEMLGTSSALYALEKVRKEKKVPKEKVQKGDSLQIDGINFDVMFPYPDFKYNKTSLPEIVLKVAYGTTTLLFLGDVSKTIQKSILSELDSIYLVEFAHMATKSRVSADLLAQLRPSVITSSKREATEKFLFR
jgi:beta-lactamase superfamily II metal-dependent hydrolase